jgi:Ca2+-binding RTX toxin-like protein
MIDPGNRMSTALDVGSLVGSVSFADSVNVETDRDDFYRVTLDRSSHLSAAFIGTGGTGSVDLKFIRDFNNNDIIDSNEVLEQRSILSTDGVVESDLPIGTYFIQVSSSSSSSSNPTKDYTLTLTNTPVGTLTVDPGNLMSQALDIGILNGSRTFSEYVGTNLDPADFYRFTLDRPTEVSLTLAATSKSLTMVLSQDLNNNDVVENNEVIASRLDLAGGQPSSLNETLQPGTYFVNLNLSSLRTNYTLNFFTPGVTPFPFGADGPFFNLSTDPDTIVLDPAQVGNLVVRALDGDDFVQGSASNDIVVGNIGNDRIVGNLGDDFLLGGRDNDRIEGNEGNDFVAGNIGNDLVYGNAGNDIVRGGQDNDSLFGGEGDDQLSGDFGTDVLTGEAGNDLFILRSATAAPSVAAADIIADFTAGQDAIALTNGLTFAGIALDASGSNTAIREVATGQILGVVAGIQPGALSAGNFATLPGDF